MARRAGRPVGTTKADTKVSTTIRFDPDVLDALKAAGIATAHIVTRQK